MLFNEQPQYFINISQRNTLIASHICAIHAG